MAFFQNDAATSGQGRAASERDPVQLPDVHNHSPKSAPLFKQEAHPVGSLSDYLARHLNPESEEAAVPSGPGTVRLKGGFNLRQAPSVVRPEYATEGQFLNSLDVDLPAGLEQYLPTLIFRLRVMKKRLDGEIFEMRGLLNKYQRLTEPSSDMQDRIRAVQHRLRVLENQERRVSWQLAEALPMGNWFFAVAQVVGQFQGHVGGLGDTIWHGLLAIFHGRAYLSVERAGRELVDLEGLYRQRLSDRVISSTELGQLINRYEHTLTVAEKKAAELSKTSFWGRLWQEARGLVK